MFLGILVMITALSISAVAIYYSVAGLVAIFAAAALPIMIMGGVLEIGKLVTAVWLHRYWREARWFLKAYLSIAVLVLMFITSMGIFGFLSKAHIEQTASAEEGVAQMARIDEELIRLGAVIERAEQRITEAEASVGEGNTAIQAQIDKEQQRIDSAYDRIQPAINEQQEIIDSARQADSNRTAPFETQLAQLDQELVRLANLANEYETRLDNLSPDTAPVNRLLEQVTQLEENIIVTTNRLQSSEPVQIRLGQATIGVTDDGLFGGNTRRALTAWVEAQQARIAELELQASELRQQTQSEVEVERARLTGLVEDIRGAQTQAVKQRQIELLATIDEVRATESPVIQRARDEIARIRASADAQIAASNELIQRLRDSLTVGTDEQVETVIAEQQQRIIEANNSIDTLTEEKYTLQAEYRKLEAEVGPVKYLAEFIYGDTADQDLLEEAVRWVILIIIFVFDPLAVLLLIASQATFEMRKAKKEEAAGESLRLERAEYEKQRAQRIIDNTVINTDPPLAAEEEKIDDDTNRSDDDGDDRQLEGTENSRDNGDRTEVQPAGNDGAGTSEYDIDTGASDDRGVLPERVLGDQPEERFSDVDPAEIAEKYKTKKKDIELSEDLIQEQLREEEYNRKEEQEDIVLSKTQWKKDHPDQTLKHYKHLYVKGIIDQLPWEGYSSKDNYNVEEGYVQNSEQSENSIFNKIRRENDKPN
jgi:hypothetical protein